MTLDEAFPAVDPGIKPLGARVLVQMRTTRTTTDSGIQLVHETQDTEKWNDQVGKVIALGPLAFCNRDTAEPWAEGVWVKVGDFIRVPRWNGDRMAVPVEGSPDPALFVIFNDHECISQITGDPLSMKNYIL